MEKNILKGKEEKSLIIFLFRSIRIFFVSLIIRSMFLFFCFYSFFITIFA